MNGDQLVWMEVGGCFSVFDGVVIGGAKLECDILNSEVVIRMGGS